MKINFVLNGLPKTWVIAPGEMFLDTLRNHHITSVKRGCDSTSCGVCTILLDGKPVPSCALLSIRVDGHVITTVEGIASEVEKIANHFGEEGADQCGFCNPSMALTVYALKMENKHATDEEIKAYLMGNLCRCTGYIAQHKAIHKYLGDES